MCADFGGEVEFVENRRDDLLDASDREMFMIGDGLVGEPFSEERKDASLTTNEPS